LARINRERVAAERGHAATPRRRQSTVAVVLLRENCLPMSPTINASHEPFCRHNAVAAQRKEERQQP